MSKIPRIAQVFLFAIALFFFICLAGSLFLPDTSSLSILYRKLGSLGWSAFFGVVVIEFAISNAKLTKQLKEKEKVN